MKKTCINIFLSFDSISTKFAMNLQNTAAVMYIKLRVIRLSSFCAFIGGQTDRWTEQMTTICDTYLFNYERIEKESFNEVNPNL